MRIHYLQHVPFENLGHIQEWAEEKHFPITKTAVYNQEAYPNPEGFDVLIVLGGPMSVSHESRYPWMKSEKAFIRSAIESKKKVIGICMGAQLIASILGANVYRNAKEEIGWHPVSIKKDHWPLQEQNGTLSVMQWHSDTFDLPEGCTLLAESEACRNQAYLYQDHVLGMQFHLEFTKEIVRRVAEDEGESCVGDYVQDHEYILSRDNLFKESKKYMYQVLDAFLS